MIISLLAETGEFVEDGGRELWQVEGGEHATGGSRQEVIQLLDLGHARCCLLHLCVDGHLHEDVSEAVTTPDGPEAGQLWSWSSEG